MDALRAALARNDPAAVDAALDELSVRGPLALIEGLRLVLSRRRKRNDADDVPVRLQYRLAEALEAAAALPAALPAEAAPRAIEAAHLLRDALNDGEGTARALALALRVAAEDDAVLRDAVAAAGGSDPAATILEKAAKKAGRNRGDDAITGRLRRALARVAELFLYDKERAFFEALKAARKIPGDSTLVDDVYRLAVDTRRLDEAAAFFQALGDEGAVSERARASALNKLGALHEARGDETAAFAAYVGSLQHHETRAARKKAERLKVALNVSTPLPVPHDGKSGPPAPTAPPTLGAVAPTSQAALPHDDTRAASPATTTAPSGMAPQIPPVPVVFPDTPIGRVGLPPPVVATREQVGLVTAVTDLPLPSIPPPPIDGDEVDDTNSVRSPAAEVSVFARKRPSPSGEDDSAAGAAVAPSDEADVAPALLLAAAREDARRDEARTHGLPIEDTATRTLVASPPVDTRDLPTVQPSESLVVEAAIHRSEGRASLTELADVAGALHETTHEGPAPPVGPEPAALRFHRATLVVAPQVRAAAVSTPASRAELPARKTRSGSGASSASDPAGDAEDTGRKGKKNRPKKKKAARGHGTAMNEVTAPAAPSRTADGASLFDPDPPARDQYAAPPSEQTTPLGHGVDPSAPTRLADEPADARATRPEDGTGAPAGGTHGAAAGPEVAVAARPAREELLARAQLLLEGDDADACLAGALDLAAVAPGEPRVLRLAARALLLEAPHGALTARAVAVVVDEARRHGERAATLVREIQRALPAELRGEHGLLWLAGARAAGHDTDRVHALLEDVAVIDAPDGPLFSFLDQTLAAAGDVDRRDALLARAALLLPAGDADNERGGDRRAVMLRRRITLLEEAHREAAALPVWSQLVLDHAVDAAARMAARRAHEQRAMPDDRARFLARLARRAEAGGAGASEVTSILRELLELRIAVDDHVGAEATARDLLARAPGESRALAVLADLLADDPRRVDEFVAVLRQRIDGARAAGDRELVRESLERLARVLAAQGRDDEAAGALVDAARTAPLDAALLERVLAGLLGPVDPVDPVDPVRSGGSGGSARVDDAVDLLEELAAGAPPRDAARLLLRGAALARERLGKKDRAHALVERAVAVQPDDPRVLEARVEQLVDSGDAENAVDVLARLVASESDVRARARIELRRGRLLEEQLLRPEQALVCYRAAVDGDRTLREAWESLLSLSRAQGDKAGVTAALTGLAQLETGRGRAAVLVRLGRVHDKERNDHVAAAAAYEAALVADPGDVDALGALLAVRALALQGERDADAALALPAPELVDDMRLPLLQAEAVGAALPYSFRRLLALAVTQDGDTEGAGRRFEALLDEKPDDLPTLLAFARHLTGAARPPAPAASAVAAETRRREVLEAVLLHHAYALKPHVHVDVWGEVCALRLQAGDLGAAKKAAKKALALVAAADRPQELEDALSDRAVRALVLALEDILPGDNGGPAPIVDEPDVALLERAIALDFDRALAPVEKARLKEKGARVALLLRRDADAARRLFEEALRHDPDASSAREALFDLELQGEDPRKVLEQSRALVAAERDAGRKAQLHLRLFQLQKRLRLPDDVAATELRSAIEHDPRNAAVLEAAERFYVERKDGRGLDALYTTRLKALDRGDVAGRLALLERLAQVRRYDVRDLRGAIDACEAISALDAEALKPREDAARMHVELGQWKEAVAAWRAVLDRDTLHVQAWRGLFSVFARSRQADEAFTVAATMTALEIADEEMLRAVKSVRPPFPRWPVPPADLAGVRRRLAHPLERSPIRSVLELVAPRLLPRLGRPLSDFGVRRSDALVERQLSPSVLTALRIAMALAGLSAGREGAPLLPLYGAELASDGATPPFAALPAREPGLIVTQEVLRGGMTPERAFALGRAVAWLSPWALLAASLDAAEIRRLLESLVAVYLSPRDLERPSVELERRGTELRAELQEGASGVDRERLTAALTPALRDWVVGRQRIGMSEWKAGVGFTGDRLGFLLCGDLPSAVRGVRASAGSTSTARQSLKELVLFSISPTYVQLRRELSLALSEQALAPVLDLG